MKITIHDLTTGEQARWFCKRANGFRQLLFSEATSARPRRLLSSHVRQHPVEKRETPGPLTVTNIRFPTRSDFYEYCNQLDGQRGTDPSGMCIGTVQGMACTI